MININSKRRFASLILTGDDYPFQRESLYSDNLVNSFSLMADALGNGNRLTGLCTC